MAVLIAENVSQNVDSIEHQQLLAFSQNPGQGGQKLWFQVNGQKVQLSHVTNGTGQRHVSIFYTRDGDDYQIVGVGRHDGEVKGKTSYKALWNGRAGHRVQVVTLGRYG